MWHQLSVIWVLLLSVVEPKRVPDFGVGWGFSYEDSNVFKWFDYLGAPQYVRVFVHPFVKSGVPEKNTADWRAFVSNSWNDTRANTYGDQFGISFSGAPVDSIEAYRAAVEDIRARARQKGDTPATTWIAQEHPAVNWSALFWPLSERAEGATLLQTGVPEEYLPRLRERGMGVMAVYDLDCHELAFSTSDPNDSMYYKERWEQYRLMYLGGLWMAEQGIVKIELYNEPDKDSSCLDEAKWIHVAQINSEALRDAAADLKRPRPTLIAPSTAATFSTTFSRTLFGYMHTRFGEVVEDPNFVLFDSYGWHAYGDGEPCVDYGKVSADCMPNGHTLRTKQNRVAKQLSAVGYGNMPNHITEFNCFGHRDAEELDGHVLDRPETAVCLGAQIGAVMVRDNIPTSMILHKLVQNRVVKNGSRVGKNGILFAQTTEPPFDIGGATKTFEVYRLILNRVSGGHRNIVKIPSPSHSFKYRNDGVIAWGLKHTDGRVLSIFISFQWRDNSYGGEKEKVTIDMKSLGVPPGAKVSFNEVERGIFGNNPELMLAPVINTTLDIIFWGPKFVEAVVPLVSSQEVAITASHACAVDPSNRYPDDSDGFAVTMDPSGYGIATRGLLPRAVLLKFDPSTLPSSGSMLRAILRLFVRAGGSPPGYSDEIVTVLGFDSRDEDWDTMSWDKARIFKKNYVAVEKPTIKDNIIDWESDAKVVGQIHIPADELISGDSGRFVWVDVTRAIKQGITSFSIVRMVRFDESGSGSGKLPQDVPVGTHVFAGTKADDYVIGRPEVLRTTKRPQLLITVENDDPIPPYPPTPAPPPPFPTGCKVDAGYFTIQGQTCLKKGLYLSHSLVSKKTGIYLKTKSQAKDPRRHWKPRLRRTGVYKGGFVTTIFGAGRKSKNSYLATGTNPRLGTKAELIRIVPYQRCDRVKLISESRMKRGQPAYLRVDTWCRKIKWGRKKDLYNTFRFERTT